MFGLLLVRSLENCIFFLFLHFIWEDSVKVQGYKFYTKCLDSKKLIFPLNKKHRILNYWNILVFSLGWEEFQYERSLKLYWRSTTISKEFTLYKSWINRAKLAPQNICKVLHCTTAQRKSINNKAINAMQLFFYFHQKILHSFLYQIIKIWICQIECF